jgi:hypothetical protein
MILTFSLLLAVIPAHAETDQRTGLIIAPGWQLVSAHCGACHSHQLVTSQRGDAEFWLNTIRWMQRTQNLWALPADQEPQIIAYLAEHYSESEWGRRPPLSPSLSGSVSH